MIRKIVDRRDPNLHKHNSKRVTIQIADEHKWYLEEVAHVSRIPERAVLFHILDEYIADHPLIKNVSLK